MELISNIKKRFNDWAYNLWLKIGNEHKWHHLRMQTIKEKIQQSKNKTKHARPIKRQNIEEQMKAKLSNRKQKEIKKHNG